jgi:hypothetical protein
MVVFSKMEKCKTAAPTLMLAVETLTVATSRAGVP